MNITFKFDTSEAGKKFLKKGLANFDSKNCPYFAKHKYGKRTKDFAFYAYEGNKRIGGVQGVLNMQNWARVDKFFIDEKYRGCDIGTQLMHQVEDFAKKHKCTGIITDTWDFQAKGFYEKMGFNLWGVLKDHPIGTTVYSFEKKL